jgi:hypothetical protein
MPTRSPADGAGTIEDLGLPPRAVTALTRAGVRSTADLAVLTRRDLAAIAGLGPGMIAAIRLVVPEPGDAARGVPPPGPGPDEHESPAAPEIPSFDSLRDPRRRTPLDVLVPAAPAAGARDAPAAAPRAPRPAEYADLLRLARHLGHTAVRVPGRLAGWWVREPVRCLRRLLGGRSGRT